MKLSAAGEFVLIRPIQKDETDGGILLPPGNRVESPMEGVLISVADDGSTEAPLNVRVFYDPYGAFKVRDLVAVKEENIIAYED